jgi:hypothetical protein
MEEFAKPASKKYRKNTICTLERKYSNDFFGFDFVGILILLCILIYLLFDLILSFQMKDCTLFSMCCNTSERHMILATITLSMGDEESLLS